MIDFFRTIMAVWAILTFWGCSFQSQHDPHDNQNAHHDQSEQAIYLTEQQFNALGMKVDTMVKRALKGYIETNGQLILPPQSQAAVTTVVGANVRSVEVIEGYKVSRGQPLAYLYHPNLIALQTEYATHINQLQYMEQAYQRQDKLYRESVSSGKEYQKVKADYLAMKATINGLQAQLSQLGIDHQKVKQGEIYHTVALAAPISGYVQSVNVRTGQYVGPQEVLFEIIQTDHIHAHFKVFETDIHKVKEGQTVQFQVESQPDIEREATVFAVGRMFESGTKAVNLHAELENEDGKLLPGMYAHGRIVIDEERNYALPKDAVVMEGDRFFVFQAQHPPNHSQWRFQPVEISTGSSDSDWLEIKTHQPMSAELFFAWNNAYYLLAEMQKGELEHHH